jgi:predicted DNA-binding WGR domain protein
MSKIIKCLSVEIVPAPAPAKYNILTINYTDAGKLASRKMFSFVAKEVYPVFAKASSGEYFEITEEKNAKGYNDFTSAKSVGMVAPNSEQASAPAATAGSPNKSYSAPASSTYSTKEERDQTQIYIVRQSSIKHAIDTITLLGGKKITQDEILTLARKYENFVFGKGNETPSVSSSAQVAQQVNEELYDEVV